MRSLEEIIYTEAKVAFDREEKYFDEIVAQDDDFSFVVDEARKIGYDFQSDRDFTSIKNFCRERK